MADRSKIEWTEATWNPLRGCTRVSAGCQHCYAERVADRFSGPGQPYEGLVKRVGGEPRWTGRVDFVESALDQPLRWKKPRMIFVNSMSDLFHESVPDAWIDRIFAVMALCPQHVFQILTKRPDRMRAYCAALPPHWATLSIDGQWPLPNVWLGVSVEDQATADERIPVLLDTPAAVRFVSAEPLLAPVRLARLGPAWPGGRITNALRGTRWPELDEVGAITSRTARLDWIIVGGESGPGARRFNAEWAESIVDQCRAAGVPCFVKQLGGHVVWHGRRQILRDKKGGDMSEWPERLRVREMPE